jgi:hypothetical protein
MLQKRNLIIKHIEGKGNVIADALSRVGYSCSELMQRFIVKSMYSYFFNLYVVNLMYYLFMEIR